MLMNKTAVLATLAFGVVACSESPRQGGDENGAARADAPAIATAAGPDQADVNAGAELFRGRACAGCHLVGGGRLVGPDLAGVLDRRDQDWVVAMILRPDSMIRNDPAAISLLAEYRTPMPNMRVSREDALKIVAYLRSGG